ncbi:hypothetical protein BgiBS90_007686, partial [Biomphalaria glabrata]
MGSHIKIKRQEASGRTRPQAQYLKRKKKKQDIHQEYVFCPTECPGLWDLNNCGICLNIPEDNVWLIPPID